MWNEVPIWDRLEAGDARAMLAEVLTKRNAKAALLKPDRIDEVVDWFFANRAWSGQHSLTKLREWGDPLTLDQRKAAGASGRGGLLGHRFAACLSDAGLRDPTAAAGAIVWWPLHVEMQTSVLRRLRDSNGLVRYRIDVRGCCRAALPLANGVCFPDEAKELPLPDCDRSLCNCAYDDFGPWHGPIENDLRNPLRAAEYDSQNAEALGFGDITTRAYVVDPVEAEARDLRTRAFQQNATHRAEMDLQARKQASAEREHLANVRALEAAHRAELNRQRLLAFAAGLCAGAVLAFITLSGR
jgi:hypothetical protein